jgi:hypothetical protein
MASIFAVRSGLLKLKVPSHTPAELEFFVVLVLSCFPLVALEIWPRERPGSSSPFAAHRMLRVFLESGIRAQALFFGQLSALAICSGASRVVESRPRAFCCNALERLAASMANFQP